MKHTVIASAKSETSKDFVLPDGYTDKFTYALDSIPQTLRFAIMYGIRNLSQKIQHKIITSSRFEFSDGFCGETCKSIIMRESFMPVSFDYYITYTEFTCKDENDNYCHIELPMNSKKYNVIDIFVYRVALYLTYKQSKIDFIDGSFANMLMLGIDEVGFYLEVLYDDYKRYKETEIFKMFLESNKNSQRDIEIYCEYKMNQRMLDLIHSLLAENSG